MRRSLHIGSIGAIVTVACGLLWTASPPSSAQEGDPRPTSTLGTIELRISGLANDSGQVCASLFNAPEGYPTRPEKALRGECEPIADQRATILFEGLPYGTYAAFAFHDEDGNSAIRQSRLGIPREPVGASNNARGRFGPPAFDDASFRLDGPRQIVPITLRGL